MMNIEGMSDADLELLTDEERAGLAEDNDDGDDDTVKGQGDDDEDDDDAGKTGEGAAAVKPGDEGGAVTPPADTTKKDDDDDDDAPVVRPDAPTKPEGERLADDAITSKLADIDTRKGKLAEQLDDGEITTKEYAEALDKLNDERSGINADAQRWKDYDQRVQSHTETVEKRWYDDVKAYLEKNPELSASRSRLVSFDEVVREVTADPANASLSNRRQLALAHVKWREDMGFTKAQEPPKDGQEPKPKPKPKPPVEIPPTLAHVPAADITDSDDGKFGFLDSLLAAGKPLEYEAALGRLSDADRDEYLARP